MTPFETFQLACQTAKPRTAIVLGSGLTGVSRGFVESQSLSFADIPGLVPPTIAGHRGQLSLGTLEGHAVLFCFGRVHFYEGHPWDRVLRLVNLIADWGLERLILTNAAGGLHPQLDPGSAMLIRGQVTLLTPSDYRNLTCVQTPYSATLNEQLLGENPKLIAGVYAGLTGPCYETPAEIRALAACQIDAVGMSTVREAQAGYERGLQVVGLSCITNKAAGLSAGTLNHAEVETTARLAVEKIRKLVVGIL
jgi:purine-nucleoside phosphorylase